MYINKNATFAYFTASVKETGANSSIIVKTAQIGTITYDNGTELKLDNAMPGAEQTKTFTIASDPQSTSDVAYTVSWDAVDNKFVNQNELVYSLTSSTSVPGTSTGTRITDISNKKVPSTNETIGSGTLGAGETHSYTLTVHFSETGSEQNDNQGKSFTGKIKVSTGDDNNGPFYNNSNKSGVSEKPSTDNTAVTE